MRKELFTIAEIMAYQKMFTDIFPENFIENHANISDISVVIEILDKLNSIDAFIKNKSELELVIDIIERNYYTSHQK